MKSIQAPTACPSCGSTLEWSNHLLYCINTSCQAQTGKRIEHFAKTMKIKGLGPSTIAKLDLADIDEIYLLQQETIASAISSEKVAEKLCSEIENSKKAPLNVLLPAFSIPLIGKSAAGKLSTTCKSIYDINETSCRQAGLGPKASANLMQWLEYEFPYYRNLPFSFEFVKVKDNKKKGVVCISGKLSSFKNKAEAQRVLEESGYEVKSSMSKQVTILVNESGIESSKTKTARESGVTIVTNLKTLIGEF